MSGRHKKVKVWVRIRPTSNFASDVINISEDSKAVSIHCRRDSKRGVVNNQVLDWSFKLDGILNNASQDDVFSTVASNIVSSTLDGYNGTMMCYGQTGAGKTFTMTGATESYQNRGLIPRSLAQLFREIEDRADHAVTVRVSYLEIYNETMFDLLSTLPESMNAAQIAPLSVVEDDKGCYVKGLSCHLTQTEEDALNLLFEGETNRAIATHSLNKVSSRSHCIFTVYIESRSRVSSEAKYVTSKLNFVDLAGSERLGKTQSVGKTKEEAMYINKSLSFLEQTVIALADRRRDHVPFRQTKLTHCLKDSIGGNCNTLLVANIWGEEAQIEETVSTMRFATRMMCVASEPAINLNTDPSVMVKTLEKEISALKRELGMHDTLTNRSQITYDPLSEQQRYDIRQQVRAYLDGKLDEIDIVNIRQIQGSYEAFRDLCNQMEKDIEARLREQLQARYTLVDKTDPAAIAAAQQAGLPVGDDGELVGEPDGSGFGIGAAPAHVKMAVGGGPAGGGKRKDAKRGKSKERGSPAPKSSSPGGASTKTTDPAPLALGGEDRRDEGTATPGSVQGDARKAQAPRPSTPPPRTEAFEEFKRELGSEINRILVDNKDVLGKKKKAYADLARQINFTKTEIDRSRDQLEQLKGERESQGPMYNADGDIIISEDEYLEIRRLKDLKAAYRADFDELRSLKSEVAYCQRLVDQCRQRLIQEFDQWYAQSFLSGGAGDPLTSLDAGHGARPGATGPPGDSAQLEDEQETFDRLQRELLMQNPDSVAYHNAKSRTQRRKTYEEASHKQLGTPTRVMKHKPPTMLQVQY